MTDIIVTTFVTRTQHKVEKVIVAIVRAAAETGVARIEQFPKQLSQELKPLKNHPKQLNNVCTRRGHAELVVETGRLFWVHISPGA